MVKASGEISRNSDGDTKIASSELKIEAELNMHELLKRGLDWVMSKVKERKDKAQEKATSGDWSTAIVAGTNSVALAVGNSAKAKASAGSAIVCCYFDYDGNLIHIRASKVGENGIKPDVYYTLGEDGEFAESKE